VSRASEHRAGAAGASLSLRPDGAPFALRRSPIAGSALLASRTISGAVPAGLALVIVSLGWWFWPSEDFLSPERATRRTKRLSPQRRRPRLPVGRGSNDPRPIGCAAAVKTRSQHSPSYRSDQSRSGSVDSRRLPLLSNAPTLMSVSDVTTAGESLAGFERPFRNPNSTALRRLD